MRISASVKNAGTAQDVEVVTHDKKRALTIPAKELGGGSAVNGGELLMLALATCYCNDLYREAQRMGIAIEAVEVEANAEFAGRGLAAAGVNYKAKIKSPEPAERIQQLLRETDAVAEVHNTLRQGTLRCPRVFVAGSSRVRSTRDGDRTDEEAIHRGTDHWLPA